MSSPISEQSGSIYLYSPMDTDHHEDTDMEYEFSFYSKTQTKIGALAVSTHRGNHKGTIFQQIFLSNNALSFT